MAKQHLSGPATLDGQVAFITGGAGGMGSAVATLQGWLSPWTPR